MQFRVHFTPRGTTLEEPTTQFLCGPKETLSKAHGVKCKHSLSLPYAEDIKFNELNVMHKKLLT